MSESENLDKLDMHHIVIHSIIHYSSLFQKPRKPSWREGERATAGSAARVCRPL